MKNQDIILDEIQIQRLNKEKGHIGESIGYLNSQLKSAETLFARELDETRKNKIKNDINKIKIQLSGLKSRLSEIEYILKLQKHTSTHHIAECPTNE